MISIPTSKLETIFVKPGTPMFSDLISQLHGVADITDSRRRDLASGLRGMAKALNQPPECIPADIGWLQPRIAKVSPAALGLSSKSWSNTLSNGRAAMAQFGITKRTVNRRKGLSPAWLDLWTALQDPAQQSIGFALSKFVFFLSAAGIHPDAVDDGHTLAFRDALIAAEIRKSPEDTYRKAVGAWNRAGQRIQIWPKQKLSVPSRQTKIAVRLDAMPKSFQEDFARHINSLEHPNPLDPDGLIKPLRPATINQCKFLILQFAGALVKSGTAIEAIADLRALVMDGQAEVGLRWMLAQKENAKTPHIDAMASMLAVMSKRYLRLTNADLRRIEVLAKKLALPRQKGMSRKNRDRLRPFGDKERLAHFFRLPDHLFKRASAKGQTQTAAIEREDALALAILQICPIRRRNLVDIHIDRNLQHPGDGRTFLVFDDAETKTRQHIEFELPPALVLMINEHLATRSPFLCPSGTGWLFPQRDGVQQMAYARMSDKISKRVKKELGLEFNPHLFRHLAAKVFLDARPGSYEAMRRILGHSSTSSTLNAYAGLEAGTATTLFAQVISKAKRP